MKQKNAPALRSMLGRVRALGSARSGTHEWYMMKLTSAALLVLALYPLFGFFIYAVYGGREGALEWVRCPFSATGIILFLIAGFHHAAHGLQVVIEDYVHCPCAKNALLFAVKFGAVACAILGILATLKISLGV